MIDHDLLEYLEGYITDNRKETFNKILNNRTRHFTVVLENIFQHHNMSAVVRSCDIFGIQDVYTIENTNIKKVSRKIAKGSQKWLNFNRYKSEINNTESCLNDLKAKGYKIIATSPHFDSCYLSDFDITQKSAFVFGMERDGISDCIKTHADGFLKIPMVGFTESLNISVAAAIILQDVTNKLRQSDVNWKLSDKEREEVYLSWIEKSIKNVDKLKNNFSKDNKN